MAAAVERAKDWWEGKAPRERKLLAALGATLVICVLAWVAITIRGGLTAIEKRNQEMREALAAIDRHRTNLASQTSQKPVVTIPSSQLALDTYLNTIINEVGLPEPTYPGAKEAQKGPYTEVSIKVALKGLNVDQLKDLLEKIETKNPVVAITELRIKKNTFQDPDKSLEVDFTVVTYYKKGAGAAGGGAKPAAGASGAGGSGTPAAGGAK